MTDGMRVQCRGEELTEYAAGRLPLGTAAWGDTLIRLPGVADGAQFRNVLTGEMLTVMGGTLRMAELCGSLPLAALQAV